MSAVIFRDGRVLLQRRDDNGLWGFPGGGVEPGESLAVAVRREVEEETGLLVEPVRVIGVYSSPDLHQVMTYPDGAVVHYISTALECVITGGTLACGPESLDLSWCDPAAPPDTLMPVARIRLRDALARAPHAFLR